MPHIQVSKSQEQIREEKPLLDQQSPSIRKSKCTLSDLELYRISEDMTFGDVAEYSQYKDCFIKLHGTKVEEDFATEDFKIDKESNMPM